MLLTKINITIMTISKKNQQLKKINRNFVSKTLKNIFSKTRIILLLLTVTLISCSSDDDDDSTTADCGNGAWTLSVQSELNAWIAAGQAFGADPSLANCNSYKSAGLAYIDALDEIRECVPNVSLADFNEALDEANAEIDAISCE